MRLLVPSALLACLLPFARAGAQSASNGQATEFWGFTGPWEAASDASVRRHGGELDAVVTGWITLDSATGRPVLPSPYADTVRPRQATLRRMALVTSWHGERFHQRSIRLLARDEKALAQTAGAIGRYARTMSYRGLVLDFEALEPADLAAQLRVMKAITDSAHARGVAMVSAAIPAADTAAYPARPLLGAVDAIIPMLYDQHWAGGEPGPISAPKWVRSSLASRVAEAGADRVIAGLPTYGYRWRSGQPTEHLSFVEARRISARTRVAMRRDRATGTLRAVSPGQWEMWVTDAVLLRTLVREVEALGVRRVALWRLGQEDPAVWGAVVR